MIINFGSKKPPKEDWKKHSCRCNYAKRIVAENSFGRKFNLVKIIWDGEGGYPEHAWGYIQYTVRPVWPGFGCDGTTDNEHHARVSILLGRLGIDADKVYQRSCEEMGEKFIWRPSDALKYVSPDIDFILPDGIPSQKEIQDMLYDLYQLNNRTYVGCIIEELKGKGIEVPDYDEPYVIFPREYPIPSSGLPVRVTTRDVECETEYYISDGEMGYCLFKQRQYPFSIDMTPYWWKGDAELDKKLATMRSDRTRRRHLEGLITLGKAPQNVMEYARKFFDIPARNIP